MQRGSRGSRCDQTKLSHYRMCHSADSRFPNDNLLLALPQEFEVDGDKERSQDTLRGNDND